MSAPNNYQGNGGSTPPQQYPGNDAPMQYSQPPYPQQSQQPYPPQQPQYATPYPNGPRPMPPQSNGPWTGGSAPADAPWYKRGFFWVIVAIAVALVGVLIWLIIVVTGPKDADAEQPEQSQTQSQQDDRTTTGKQQGTNNSDKTDGTITEDNDAFECDANGYCRMKNFGKTGVPELDEPTDDSADSNAATPDSNNALTEYEKEFAEKLGQTIKTENPDILTEFLQQQYEQGGVSEMDRISLEYSDRCIANDFIKLKTEINEGTRKILNDDIDQQQELRNEILEKY